MPASNKKPVALVLSGGGARGMAHIGVIEEILKKDFTITSIAGPLLVQLSAEYIFRIR